MLLATTSFTPGSALVGGIMIGIAAGLVLSLNGAIAGVSGILARALQGKQDQTAWRVLFLLGIAAGAFVAFRSSDAAAEFESRASLPQLAIAGLLVGFGARLSGGCTSGHGVCGVARLSKRGITGTLVFMATGALTVYLVDQVWKLR